MILGRNWIWKVFFDDESLGYLVYLTAMATLVGATNTIISAPTRMHNKRVVYLIANTVSPIVSTE